MTTTTSSPVFGNYFVERCARYNPQRPIPAGPNELVKGKKRSHQDSEESDANAIELEIDDLDEISAAPLPEKLISPETLVYIGLRPEAAEVVWDSWLSSPPDIRHIAQKPALFLQRAIAFIERCGPDAVGKDADWRLALHNHGLNEEAIELIMEAEFEDVRLSRSAKYWVEDTLRSTFWELVEDLR
ncbi:hypothetical protein K490DRAFT_65097 [Saccharata proteae CBS 121410]|uniref:Uncharacterized protein n=1 Tax=Saccharata proteae CBS 121410 TaxID=1314787 RepID=A0A9P4HXR1_9PEZI|nr:hypothetical protein K490DRAFT_65097 [Saccharata proteae CBS 121410]